MPGEIYVAHPLILRSPCSRIRRVHVWERNWTKLEKIAVLRRGSCYNSEVSRDPTRDLLLKAQPNGCTVHDFFFRQGSSEFNQVAKLLWENPELDTLFYV